MGLCLVSFIQNLILYVPGFVPLDVLFIRAIFHLIQFIILVILLKLVVNGKLLREGLSFLLVAFVSIVITIYNLKGIPFYIGNIEIVQSLLLILINIVALLQLIRKDEIHIFLSPLFWITAGTFFYYCMFLLTQCIPEYRAALQGPLQHQKKVLLLIIIIIQFIFYIIGASVAGRKKSEDLATLY